MAVNQLVDYIANYPNDGITYKASSMVLAAHSDTSFLTKTNACIHASAHIFALIMIQFLVLMDLFLASPIS